MSSTSTARPGKWPERMNAFPELSSFGALTPWGLILLMLASFFFLLSRGKLYTGGQHRDAMNSKDEIIGIYKDRGDKLEVANTQLLDQNGKLVETNGIVNDFFKKADRLSASTPNEGHNGNLEGGSHVRT